MQKLSVSKVIKEPGYVYIYISNEGSVQQDIYFDDLEITHDKSRVVQADDYYPFGLTFNGYGTENSAPNRWRFQGQQHIDDIGLNWDSFKWRNHQPDIGRFFNVDPLACKYESNSPYAFSENDVVSSIELEGLERLRVTNYSPMQSENLKELIDISKRQFISTEAKEAVRKKIDEILEYSSKHGFVDDNGNKSDYIIKKLEQAGIPLPETVRLNYNSTITQILEEDGDFVVEYYGILPAQTGKLSEPTKLGERNYSEEYRLRTEALWIKVLDFFGGFLLPNQLFRVPVGPFYFNEDYPRIPMADGPSSVSPPNPEPAPTPEPAPEPDPEIASSP